MSSNTKAFEEKMKSSVEHLDRELAAVRAGRANPAVLDKVSVDYYGAPTPHPAGGLCGRERGPHPDHYPLGPHPAARHQQGNHGQRRGHHPHLMTAPPSA